MIISLRFGVFTIASLAHCFTAQQGQIYTPGIVIIDAPQPHTSLGGDYLQIAIDVSSNGQFQLPHYPHNPLSTIHNITIFLSSYITGMNFTVINGTVNQGNFSRELLLQEPGSTVKHVKWIWPDCLVSNRAPQENGLGPAKSGNKPQGTGLGSLRGDNNPQEIGLGPARADNNLQETGLGPARADINPKQTGLGPARGEINPQETGLGPARGYNNPQENGLRPKKSDHNSLEIDSKRTTVSVRGSYNISIRQNFRLNGRDMYTIFDLPITIDKPIPAEYNSTSRPLCGPMNNPLMDVATLATSADSIVWAAGSQSGLGGAGRVGLKSYWPPAWILTTAFVLIL